jgi:ATP dependent DNA ligase domain/ATP dependent DNA ligase C terminal region
MPASTLLDLGRFEIKLGSYAVGPANAVNNPMATAIAQDYRRGAAARMIPLGKEDIRAKIPSSDFFVSRKIDGEFTVLMYDEEQAYTINPGGTVRVGLPWLDEAAEAFKKAGIRSARIAGELYVFDDRQRTRVHDVSTVARSPRNQEDLNKLRFAPFDIIEIDGQTAGTHYADTFQTLESLFGKTQRVQPVQTEVVKDTSGIARLFEQWVEKEEAEGLVVRSDAAGLFKVKPRHTLDVVVVGFTESTEDRQGMLHDLLVAVMRADGTYHILTRVGGGFSEEVRRQYLSDLKDMVVTSEYVEVNSDYVAYQMVRPKWIVEISCLDLISQTTRGGHVNRMVIDFDPQSGYKVVRRLPLASVISPQFVRRRDDKQIHPDDIRIGQVSDRVEVALTDADAKSFKLPEAQVRWFASSSFCKPTKRALVKTTLRTLSTLVTSVQIAATRYSVKC